MRISIPIVCSVVLAASAANAAEPTGEWLVEDGNAMIRIENCGGILWGVVAWEKAPGRDTNNPDPAMRSRPTLGMPILLGLKPVMQKRWEGNQEAWEGHVYNAKNGKMYDVSVRLASPATLHIEGCVLGGLFCGGQDWARAQTAPPPAQATPAPKAKSAAKNAQAAAPAVSDVCSRVSSLPGGTH